MWELLNRALSLIPAVTVEYRQYIGSSSNSFGVVVAEYGDPVTIANAHVQPVKSEMYPQLGLQLGKNLREVFIPANLNGMEEISVGGDILIFENKTWRIISDESWYSYDGWKVLTVIEEKDYNVFQN